MGLQNRPSICAPTLVDTYKNLGADRIKITNIKGTIGRSAFYQVIKIVNSLLS